MANDYTGRIAPLLPGCIGRAAELLALAGANLGDGTAAQIMAPVAANYTAALSTASAAIAGAGHFVVGAIVSASGASAITFFDNPGTGSSGSVIGFLPSGGTLGFIQLGGARANLGIVAGGGASAPVYTLLWN